MKKKADIMTVNLIFSFSELKQKFDDLPLTTLVMNDKEVFFHHVTGILTQTEKEQLGKISCCVYTVNNVTLPKWYNDCNGKFWDDEIPELMEKIHGVITTYEPINK